MNSDFHIKNSSERDDFTCGHRICKNFLLPWKQRITDKHGLIVSLSGSGTISFESHGIQVERGDLVLMKPGFKHCFEPQKGWDYLWFHFAPRPHVIHALEWPECRPGLALVRFQDAEFEAVRNALSEAHLLELRRPYNWNALACLLLESALVRGYNRGISEHSHMTEVIIQVQQLLLETQKNINQIATLCGLSRATLYVKFRNAMGISPRQYRERAILRRAAQLLEQPEFSIAEIGCQVGMPDPYYFSTRFHRFFGLSPRDYRKQRITTPGT